MLILIILAVIGILIIAYTFVFFKYFYRQYQYSVSKKLKTGGFFNFVFTFNEIIANECYSPLNIPKDEAVIFDIGANIGLFPLYVDSICKSATVYSFEPIPQLYELILTNVKKNIKPSIKFIPINSGLSSEEKDINLNYVENASAMSTIMDDIEDKKINSLKHVCDRMLFPKISLFIMLWYNRLVVKKAIPVKVHLTTFSKIIEEYKIEKIDAVKLDVEGFELEVLKGIKKDHFKIIDRFMIEVENFRPGLLDSIIQLLKENGFNNILILKEGEPWVDVVAS